LFSFICDEKIRYKVKTRPARGAVRANYSSAQTLAVLFMLMNTAPAELLQLLTIAALQPSPPILRPATLVHPGTLFTSQPAAGHEKKKPPCLK
jgi:hypothetical protein